MTRLAFVTLLKHIPFVVWVTSGTLEFSIKITNNILYRVYDIYDYPSWRSNNLSSATQAKKQTKKSSN